MDKLYSIWQKIDNAVFTFVKYVCVLLLTVLVAVVFYIFFGRYVLNNSPMWGEPLSLLCLVWMSVLGSAMVVRSDEHLKVTIFDNKMSKAALTATDILATACVFVFAIFLMVYGTKLTLKATGNTMGGLGISFSWMYVSMPVTGILYVFALIDVWMRRLVKK